MILYLSVRNKYKIIFDITKQQVTSNITDHIELDAQSFGYFLWTDVRSAGVVLLYCIWDNVTNCYIQYCGVDELR